MNPTLKELLDPCADALIRIERVKGKRYLIRSESLEIDNKLHIQERIYAIDSNRFMGMRGGKMGEIIF